MKTGCVGCFLGAMAGDILGAPVEGYSAARIRAEFNGRPLRDFIDPNHLSDFVFARRLQEEELRQGASLQLPPLQPRLGLYTDDTNGLLAIACSLVDTKCLDAEHCALSTAEAWAHVDASSSSIVERGYPRSSAELFEALLLGEEDYREIGRRRFSEGSTSNGGAMRIASIGLAFRNLLLHHAPSSSSFSSSSSSAFSSSSSCSSFSSFSSCSSSCSCSCSSSSCSSSSSSCCCCSSSSSSSIIQQHQEDEQEQPRRKQNEEDDEYSFREAVRTAILSTHVHPDAVDAAAALARCVALCALTPASSVSELRPERVLKFASDGSRSEELRSRLDPLIKALSQPRPPQQKEEKEGAEGDEEHMYDKQVLNSFSEWFQLKAADAVATALWMFVRHGLPASASSSSSKPEECLIRTIAIGGDCDTIGCMVGALLEALLGASWLPERCCSKWKTEREEGTMLSSWLKGLVGWT